MNSFLNDLVGFLVSNWDSAIIIGEYAYAVLRCGVLR